jgi:hypothetical protein
MELRKMPQFSSIKQLEVYINKLAKDTLQQKQSNVKEAVVDELVQSIDRNVYDAYTPSPKSPYTRQKDNGGLTDRDNFAVDSTSDGVAIYSTRKGENALGEDVTVAEIVSGYEPYSIPDRWGYGYEEPRKFMEPARENLRGSRKLSDAFKRDLKVKGLNVE